MRECDFCIKQNRHGGHCEGRWGCKPCLLYERDPRGKPIIENMVLPVPFWLEIPECGKDTDYYEAHGIDKTLKIIKIKKIEWDKDNEGLHGIIIHAEVMYWSDENGKWPDENRPKFKVIKGMVK